MAQPAALFWIKGGGGCEGRPAVSANCCRTCNSISVCRDRRKREIRHFLQNPTDGLFSPTIVVHRAHGFRFVIYTADHEPAHVHVTGPGQAKINLLGSDGEVEVVWSIGIKRSDLRRLVDEVSTHRIYLLQEWERIHGQSD